jgi:hypothetical protein
MEIRIQLKTGEGVPLIHYGKEPRHGDHALTLCGKQSLRTMN